MYVLGRHACVLQEPSSFIQNKNDTQTERTYISSASEISAGRSVATCGIAGLAQSTICRNRMGSQKHQKEPEGHLHDSHSGRPHLICLVKKCCELIRVGQTQ